MKNKALCLMAGMVALSAMASGCGGGSSSKGTTTTTPTIVVVNGYRGYYNGAVFCDWANNYCGTGLSYGIVLPTIVLLDGYYGYYDGTLFCNYLNDYCDTGLYWGIGDDGTICDYTYCGGVIGSGGSTGSTGSGGTTSGGSSGSGGTTSGGSSGSGGTVVTSGGSSGSSGSGSSGNYGSGGSSGSGSTDYAVTSGTKDVGLQQAQVKQANINTRAQALVSQFGMSFSSAQVLTQLSDRMNMLKSSGQISAEDQASLADAALGVAGINPADARSAVSAKINNGDSSKIDALIEQGAVNLGMPSSAALRSQILPSLGLQF